MESDNETECAFAYVFEYLQESGKNVRPYILHRIDKETSGVLVFAKDAKIYSMLKMHWNEYVTLREYYAVSEVGIQEIRGLRQRSLLPKVFPNLANEVKTDELSTRK